MTLMRPPESVRQPVRAAKPTPALLSLPPDAAPPARDFARLAGLVPLLGAAAMMPWLMIGLLHPPFAIQLVLGVVSVLLVLTAAMLVVAGVARSDLGIARWRIGSWHLLWSSLVLGVLSLQWLENDPSAGFNWVSLIDRSSVIGALAMVAVAYGAWAVGYRLGPPRLIVGLATTALSTVLGGSRSVLRGPAMPWLVYGLGTAGYLVNFALTGRYGYVGDPTVSLSNPMATTQPVYFVSQMTLVGVGGAAFRAFDPMIRGGRATLWTLFAIELLTGMLRGSKEAFFLTMLAVLIPYGAVRRRLPWHLLAASVVLLLAVAVPFNAAYREIVRQNNPTGGVDSASLSSALSSAPNVLSDSLKSADGRQRSNDVFLFRIRMIDSVAIVWQRTPTQIPYLDPVRFLRAPFIGMVPRAIWPDKPVENPGWMFGQVYFDQPPTIFSASAVTPVSDLYRSGGWPILLPGMLIMGMGYRMFDGLFRPEADPRAFAFIIAVFPSAVKAESDYYTMLTSLPAHLVIGILGAWLMCRSSKRLPLPGG
ncbi:hypothetical protein ACFFWC_15205 [Plantactinospora siamensis]|uniref:O-antigen polysaccharide polymerase Wzy n=1 Tax=Plantactinospora siamensis TaxID=555372 RepID=A0ABV6P0P1_9ACTN